MTCSNQQFGRSAVVLFMTAVTCSPAAAQSHSQPRIEISANVGANAGATKFAESDSFPSNGGETATVSVNHGVKTALGFSGGAAVKIISQFSIGAQYAVANMKPSASVTAVVPHP